jgi:hypothetical protein
MIKVFNSMIPDRCPEQASSGSVGAILCADPLDYKTPGRREDAEFPKRHADLEFRSPTTPLKTAARTIRH